ncbi:MAG TPA: DUF1993 domain-containing protein [Rhodanobacteraceae bacterium]|jgi:hypothetical protein|nr:DUF1993 domain-containing protein [Rhodanobacteraceae bacterium]
MTHPLYSASVPVYAKMLEAFDRILAKTEKHVEERKIEPDALLQARLFPDMFPFVRQVQIACDFAKSVPARLAAVDVPSYEDNERTFAELHERIAKTLKFGAGIDPAKFDGAERRAIVLRPGTPRERKFDGGESYLLKYGIPQFFFHLTTAYALLRHNGVELGKADYMGER